MNATDFVRRWAAAAGNESGSAQPHFIDLCALLGEKAPHEADPSRTFYMFEAGARGPDGQGFADVWLKDKFAWEYKGKGRDLTAAYAQVNRYREALGNPPLLVVCDFDRYEIHTNWTNTENWIYSFSNDAIGTEEPVQVTTGAGDAARGAPRLTALQTLKALFADPGSLKPKASRFPSLRKWHVDDMRIARFVTRMFATDVGLLPRGTFAAVLETDLNDNKAFRRRLGELFSTMNTGGDFGPQPIRHFNGRLFGDSDVPVEVSTEHILILKELNGLNWADVEPSIFGTFFEQILDPASRQKLGAHYTSSADIGG